MFAFKLTTFILTTLVFSWKALARVEGPSSTTEAGTCVNCYYVETSQGTRLKDNMNYVTNLLSQINDRFNWAGMCQKFSTENSLGPWGKAIRSEFMSGQYEYLEKGPRDILRICPTYAKMKMQDKANVWVLIFNGMAHYESSCNPNTKATGPNGALKGLMQLHMGAEGRYAKACDNGDGSSPLKTFSCTFSMINDQIRRDQDLFSRKSYWDVLRPQAESKKAQKIAAAVRAYTPCNDETKLNAKRTDLQLDEEVFNALSEKNPPSPQKSLGIFDI